MNANYTMTPMIDRPRCRCLRVGPIPISRRRDGAGTIWKMQQTYHVCEECGCNSLHTRTPFSPWLGLALTGVTCGLFIVPWICIAIWEPHRPWRCKTCGLRRCVVPDGFARATKKARFSVWRVLFGSIIGMGLAASIVLDDARHSLFLSTMGVGLGTFVVWTTVRAINQRDSWSRWVAITLLALAGYALSAGPAYRVAHLGAAPRWLVLTLEFVYFPVIWLGDHGPDAISKALETYFDLWR